MTAELKLQIELVPRPLWWVNPRKLMVKSQWDRTRKQVYADYNHQCGLCSAQGQLEAHERWEYDDAQFIQRLVGLIALCPSCHRIKHFGLSQKMAAEGKLDIEQLIRHFSNVNGCTREEFEAHRSEAFKKWRERSQHQNWRVDWGPYQHLIDESRAKVDDRT